VHHSRNILWCHAIYSWHFDTSPSLCVARKWAERYQCALTIFKVDSQASSFLIDHVFSYLSAHVKLMPCSIHLAFCQPPHLGLLPGLAVHFPILPRPGIRDMTPALSLSRCHAVCLRNTTCFCTIMGPYSQLSNFYIWNLTVWIWHHGLHFNVSTSNVWSRTLSCLWHVTNLLLYGSATTHDLNQILEFVGASLHQLTCHRIRYFVVNRGPRISMNFPW